MSDETPKDPTFDVGQLVKKTGGDYEWSSLGSPTFAAAPGG